MTDSSNLVRQLLFQNGNQPFSYERIEKAKYYIARDRQKEAVKHKRIKADAVADIKFCYQPIINYSENINHGKTAEIRRKQPFIRRIGPSVRDKSRHKCAEAKTDYISECGFEYIAETAAAREYRNTDKS